jgi:hypothetical protein
VPIIVAVLAWLTGGSNRLTVTRWAGLAGVALLAGARCRRSAGWPITEVLLVAVCYAIGPLIANRKLASQQGKTASVVAADRSCGGFVTGGDVLGRGRRNSAAVPGSVYAGCCGSRFTGGCPRRTDRIR